MFNEGCLTFVCYSMFVFTDWVDSGEVKYFIGWFMIVLTMIFFILNIVRSTSTQFKNLIAL
jgi:hypothetical protein